MHRLAESKDVAKQALVGLEKEALLLDLIPVAFNDELDKEVQFNCLFVNTKDSINIIWDFILVSFRFFGEPTGIYACYFEEFKRLTSFTLKIQLFQWLKARLSLIYLDTASTLTTTCWDKEISKLVILPLIHYVETRM